MTDRKPVVRAAPFVRMLGELEAQDRPAKPSHNNPVTVEEFEREHMGIAAKE